MDLEAITEIATVVTKLKMYPYFDVANYILMSLMVRDDNHPPATGEPSSSGYLYAMVYCSVIFRGTKFST